MKSLDLLSVLDQHLDTVRSCLALVREMLGDISYHKATLQSEGKYSTHSLTHLVEKYMSRMCAVVVAVGDALTSFSMR